MAVSIPYPSAPCTIIASAELPGKTAASVRMISTEPTAPTLRWAIHTQSDGDIACGALNHRRHESGTVDQSFVYFLQFRWTDRYFDRSTPSGRRYS